MGYLAFGAGDISPCWFILGWAFYHPPKPPFSWFAWVTASCQGLKAAAEVDIGKLSSMQKDLEKLLEKHPHLKKGGSDVNVNTNENVRLKNEVEYIIPSASLFQHCKPEINRWREENCSPWSTCSEHTYWKSVCCKS